LDVIANSAPKGLFLRSKVGLEKESLRVAPGGSLAQTPHPLSLGSALTNPHITTDYSEALLEFVTPAFHSKQDVLAYLNDCQAFVYQQIDDEILWSTSMPCVLAGETSIPIAQYGSSNLGTMKTVYRRGLGHRYGRVMQVIAGVHYNFSFSGEFWEWFIEAEKSDLNQQDFVSDYYFRTIRNFQRVGWLIPYLFGASPAVCKSFLHGQSTDMESFDESTFYYPYATSLRMGDIGYQNNIEKASGIRINYDNLHNYINSLAHAISTPYPPYEKIGVKTPQGYQQLSANLLQIENEYYSSVRPKQICPAHEMPINGLKNRGVAYIELRSLDVNAFEPTGIHDKALCFLEVLVLYCLLQPSPAISDNEHENISKNIVDVAHKGREPGLKLLCCDGERSLVEWAKEIFEDLLEVAALLDENSESENFTNAIKHYMPRVENPDETPSARMLAEMREKNEGFFHFALRKSQEHNQYFKSLQLSEERNHFFKNLSKESLENQALLEAKDTMSFDEFLANYFSQNLKDYFHAM
jgi:glutamate--cysteine ligase